MTDQPCRETLEELCFSSFPISLYENLFSRCDLPHRRSLFIRFLFSRCLLQLREDQNRWVHFGVIRRFQCRVCRVAECQGSCWPLRSRCSPRLHAAARSPPWPHFLPVALPTVSKHWSRLARSAVHFSVDTSRTLLELIANYATQSLPAHKRAYKLRSERQRPVSPSDSIPVYNSFRLCETIARISCKPRDPLASAIIESPAKSL